MLYKEGTRLYKDLLLLFMGYVAWKVVLLGSSWQLTQYHVIRKLKSSRALTRTTVSTWTKSHSRTAKFLNNEI